MRDVCYGSQDLVRCRWCVGRLAIVWLLVLAEGLGVLAQTSADEDIKEPSAARMEAMQQRAKSLEVWSGKTRVELLDVALLRYTSLTGEPAAVDASVWAWGRTGRPAAIAAIFFEQFPRRTRWSCELLSLSDGPVKVQALPRWEWKPATSKIRFSPVPNAPPAADSEAGRSRQMKEFARRFTASESFGEARTDQLRLMIRALHRYVDPERGLLDGAIYSFAGAGGTNPEVLLLLELRRDADGGRGVWQYGLARMGAAACEARLDGRIVWECAPVERWDNAEPYYSMFGSDAAVFGEIADEEPK